MNATRCTCIRTGYTRTVPDPDCPAPVHTWDDNQTDALPDTEGTP